MTTIPGPDTFRAECAGNGWRCPSCLINWSDLPDRHMLIIDDVAKCAKGKPVDLATAPSGVFRLVANTHLLDSYRRASGDALDDAFGLTRL